MIRLIDAHLFYEYFVRQSVGKATKGRNVKIKKHDFLGGYIRQKSDSFFVKIRLIDAHLFYEYFVRQSVGHATKGRNVKIKKHDFLEDYIQQSSDSFL